MRSPRPSPSLHVEGPLSTRRLTARDATLGAQNWDPERIFAAGPLLDATLPVRADRNAAGYRAALDALAIQADAPVALSLKLPFCAAHCLCCDRDIQAAQPSAVVDRYVHLLERELLAVAERAGGARDVLQLHLGGGTATELSESQLVGLAQTLQRAWRLPADAEMSVECDPRRATATQLQLLGGLGFRRVTFGLLDLDPAVQRAIGRSHSAALIDDACTAARDAGIDFVTLDLMIGLPNQTLAGWRTTLDRVLAMAPDRLHLGRYRHQPWRAPAQCAIDAGTLPTLADVEAHAALTAQMLCDAGYRWLGDSLFVLDGDDLAVAFDEDRLRRNLIGFTGNGAASVLGVGAGAMSEIGSCVFWHDDSLTYWSDTVGAGQFPVAHVQAGGAHEAARRLMVERLSCRATLARSEVPSGLEAGYERLARRAAEGLVTVDPDRVVLTAAGRHALRSLCAEFDGLGRSEDRATAWMS